MNISDIKKNRFLISLVGGVIFVIAFYFCVVSPFRSRNVKKMENLERLLTRLERYGGKGYKIHNEKWIKAEKAKLEAIKKVQREYELFYKERDSQFEKIFVSASGEEIKDEALWGNRYIEEINILLERIKECEIFLGQNALPFKQWELKIPTWEEIVPEQKRFWITEELVNIILKQELKVDSLKGINFDMNSAFSTNANMNLYDIIPFTIKVSMEVESLLFFINELLKSKLPLEINTINIGGRLNRFRVPEGAGKSFEFDQSVQNRKLRPSSIVDVAINAYVLDFKI